MRILYFSRDYTSHDHRFLTALARIASRSEPAGADLPPLEGIYYLRLERKDHETEDRALPPEVEQVHWAGGHRPAGWRDGLWLLKDLKRVIREVQPDLIQGGPIQRSAFLVALAGFRPLVSMSWGYDLLVDARRSRAWRWATRFTLQRSAALVGDCDTIRRLAIAYGMRDERIVTFPWGVDLRHFSPQSHPPVSDATFTLLSTRAWEPLYGVDVIARAFVEATQAHPELRLILLGNGSLAGELRHIFTQAGVSDRVTFSGQVGFSDLPRYYRMADLYLSASHSDGSSISLLEAMACGVPALVSDIPGNREWVTAGQNGWLFTDGDSQDLSRAITTAIQARDKLPEMGRVARRLVEGRADWEVNFPSLLRAYRIAMNRSG